MSPKIREFLMQCVAGKAKDDFVLTRSGNRPVRDFRDTWESLCTESGVPGLLVHDLRRSAARQLRRAGVAESVIMKIGGWLTASVFRRYAITSNADKTIAMEKLEQQRILNEQASTDFGHKFG